MGRPAGSRKAAAAGARGIASFSPDGSRLAFARGGHVWIVGLPVAASGGWFGEGRRRGRLTAGGSRISLRVARSRSSRVHGGRRIVRFGSGTALDWQPLPSFARRLQPPRGSTVLASNREAVVFSRQRLRSVYGCLEALGRTRVLLDTYGGPTAAARCSPSGSRDASRRSSLTSEGQDADWRTRRCMTWAAVRRQTWPLRLVCDPGLSPPTGSTPWRWTRAGLPPGARPRDRARRVCRRVLPIGVVVRRRRRGGRHPQLYRSHGRSNRMDKHGSVEPRDRGVSCPSSLAVRRGRSERQCAHRDRPERRRERVDETATISVIPHPARSRARRFRCAWPVAAAARRHDHPHVDRPDGRHQRLDRRASLSMAEDFYAVSCPSVSLCVATTTAGDVFTATDPTGGASAWTKTTSTRGAPPAPSRARRSRSASPVDYGGHALTSTDPAGSASAWRTDHDRLRTPVSGLSCPSVSLCVAVDGLGNVLTTTDPTGSASAWTKARARSTHTGAPRRCLVSVGLAVCRRR